MQQREAKDAVYAEYQEKIDAYLRKKPWDDDGVRTIEQERDGKIAEVEAQYPLPEMEGDMPAVLYGMNPAEMWDSVIEKQLREIRATQPRSGDFAKKNGEVNWDKYWAAREQWESALPEIGQATGGTYAGMDTKAALDAFNQQHDSPLQAAQQLYKDLVEDPTWNEWRGLKEQGVKGGEAFDRTVGTVAAVKAVDLIPWIQEQYRARGWSEQELRAALKGVIFPPMEKQREKKDKAKSSGSGSGTSDYRIPYETYERLQAQKAAKPWRQVYGKPWYERQLPQWAPPQ
jgi:hypothetical protein